MKPHLLLIDALNLIRRIYAVDVNQKHHSDDQMIEACCARVAHACKKLLNTTNATHAIAVFDGDRSWRYHFYKNYKHSRSPMPQILKDALIHFKTAIEETGIVVFEPINDEADDIITTLSCKAATNNVSNTIVSTDKGFLPHLGQYITIYDYFKKQYLDEHSIKERFGVQQSRLVDFWALAGDKTNDIPGVKGIGIKSAQQLINNYNTVEQALEDKLLSPSIHKKLEANMEMYVISKQLVSLRTDINLGFSLKQLRLS
ncbi:flap endonuclease Xni [Pseudoalteromonas fuliginea]|uniref:Flap endonuclease Xni n=1 Tax=Pseudoalteromonas fuliginea TaxID=1872678 RepID=A0ABQ6RN16_9GAMM|nr:flap endonuclease Xni [Pseudoalteromonas fuliginea]KAA1165453.1 flap endonuclease Xni [Pseudoalteromonas fuliginea]KAA1169561.1 flap endonuclease Xni [Pseudoalteromonas fuliginea]